MTGSLAKRKAEYFFIIGQASSYSWIVDELGSGEVLQACGQYVRFLRSLVKKCEQGFLNQRSNYRMQPAVDREGAEIGTSGNL
jgi:hypothetical protein